MSDLREQLRAVLEQHWLHELKCNHDEKTDDVSCACGWTGKGYPSVGEAVSRWAAHVCNVLASQPSDAPSVPSCDEFVHTREEPASVPANPAPQPSVSVLLDFLDDEAEKWAGEISLIECAERIAGDSSKVVAFCKQSFIEGAYRAARGAAVDKKETQ